MGQRKGERTEYRKTGKKQSKRSHGGFKSGKANRGHEVAASILAAFAISEGVKNYKALSPCLVIPADAGIQEFQAIDLYEASGCALDSRLRGNDGLIRGEHFFTGSQPGTCSHLNAIIDLYHKCLSADDSVDLNIDGPCMTMQPTRKQNYCLAELLAEMPDGLPRLPEWENMRAAGQELN